MQGEQTYKSVLIKELEDGREPLLLARYMLPAKKALIAYLFQMKGNYNTWEYPEDLEGIWESTTKKDTYYFHATEEEYGRDVVIGVFPRS